MKKKIFIGTNNIASMYKDLENAFGELNFEIFSVSRFNYSSSFINDTSDIKIYKLKNAIPYFWPRRISAFLKSKWDYLVDWYILNKSINKCDIFLFISDSFNESFSELKIIREKKKKIFFIFTGDDVRWYSAMKQEFSQFGLHPIEYNNEIFKSIEILENRLTKIRTVEKYADHIFSRVDQAQLQMRPYYRWNMMVSPSFFINYPTQREFCPLIVHAPSNRAIKGTKYLLAALGRIKSEGVSFELKLIENLSNLEAIKLYQDADILVDQLLCPGSGKLSTEALATGTIVLSNMSYEKYPQNNPSDCPIIDVNPDTIYQKLKSLICDFEFRKKHALLGRAYVEKYLDVKYFCEKIVKLSNDENIPFDYQPKFFREEYKPQSIEEIELLNKYTLIVKDESWYNKYVQKGERCGLIF
jgi:hypothetical protein